MAEETRNEDINEDEAPDCSAGRLSGAATAEGPKTTCNAGLGPAESLMLRCKDSREGNSRSSSREDAPVTSSSYSSAHTSIDCGGPADRYAVSSGLRATLFPGVFRGTSTLPDELQQEQHASQCQEQQNRHSNATSTGTLGELPLLPFVKAHSFSPMRALSSSNEGDKNTFSSGKSKGGLYMPPSSVRRCCRSGAAPDHVSASRHANCGLGGPPRMAGGFLFGRYFSPSASECLLGLTPDNSGPTMSGSCSKVSSCNSSRNSLAGLHERRFSFTGVTTRSLWSTRICTCRPSPIVAANRSGSNSSSSALTLLPDASASNLPATEQPVAATRRCSTGGKSCSSSSRSSDSSMFEGDRQLLLPTADTSAEAEGNEVLEFDDPLVRLQSLRLQHQPRSPLLLMRCCSSQGSDILQRLGGDTCPMAADPPQAVNDSPLEHSLSSGPPQIPASVGSCYGFTWGTEVTARVTAYEKKVAAQRKRHAKRWDDYLASDPSLGDRKALKKLVRRGIPDHLRGKLWASFLGADALLDADPEAFERLQQEELPRDVSGQIELDLPRTFPNNKRFRCSGGICALRRVLRGFAAARPAVGYCQGLNFLAATLLLFQKQELALASLLQLVMSEDKDTGLQIGRYYSLGMTDLRRDLKVLEMLIRQKSPRVFHVLRKTGVEVEWLAAEWFLCLFSTSCPEPTVLRIWDCLMLEGPKILFRVALGVIFFFESQLAKMQVLEQVMGSLKGKLALLVEHDELLHICFHKLRSFPRRRLQWLQQTVAAGLGDPCRSAPQQQQQQHQLEEQQLNRQISRRSRLLSFGRVSRQQSACEVAVHPLTQKSSKWRQKLPKVNIGMRRREAPTTNRQGASSYGGSNAPEVSCAASDQGSSSSQFRSMGTPRPYGADCSGRPKGEQRRPQQERG